VVYNLKGRTQIGGVSKLGAEKTEDMVEGWRRLRNEELHNLYSSPNTIREVKLMRMRWVGHVARMGHMVNA
jgi:hypothetical protein